MPPGTAAPPPAPTRWDDLTAELRALRARAGSPSYAELTRRVGAVRAARGVPERERRPGRVTVYDAFRDGRTRLDVELLADLVRALGGSAADARAWRDAHAAVAQAGSADPVTPSPAPAMLRAPEPVAHLPVLRGRDPELATLAAWLADPARSPVAVVTGLPGVGATALVLAAAARHHARAGARVLIGAGTDVDVLAGALDPDPGPGALLVLDDVPGPGLVAGLTARAPGWALLVTSRRALPVPGATTVTLAPLDPDAATALLADLAGADRVAAEPGPARALAAACGHLPVTLAVAAGQVAARPAWSLADHVHRVAESPHGSPALDTAYRALPPDEALVLRRLALHPAALAPGVLAVLAGLDEPTVRRSLAALEDEHLVQPAPDGTSTVHVLVRRLVTGAAQDEEPVSSRRAAVARLAERLLAECRELVPVVAPHHDLGAAAAEPPPADEARARLDRLRPVAVGTATLCASLDLPGPLGALSGVLAPYLDLGGHWQDAATLHGAATEAADPAGRSRAGRDLGRVLERLGRYDEALAQLVRAHESGHDPRPGQTLNRIGNVYKRLGRTEEARGSYADAAVAARAAGDAVSEGRAVGNHADALRVLGRHAEAFAGYDAAARLSARVGDVVNLAAVAANSALALEQAGDLPAARARVAEARAAAERLGDPGMISRAVFQDGRLRLAAGDLTGAEAVLREAVDRAVALEDAEVEAEATASLGLALLRGGDAGAAGAAFAQARELAVRLRARLVEAEAHNGLGRVALRTGRTADARAAFTAALALSDAAADPGERVVALLGLGDCAAADGDPDGAAASWRTGLAEADRLALPVAGELRARLR